MEPSVETMHRKQIVKSLDCTTLCLKRQQANLMLPIHGLRREINLHFEWDISAIMSIRIDKITDQIRAQKKCERFGVKEHYS